MRRIKCLFCIILMLTLLASCAKQPDPQQQKIEEFNALAEKGADDTKAPEEPAEDTSDESLYALQQVKVNLYFYDEKANQLSPEIRPMTKWSDSNLTQYVIKELIGGPETSGLSPVISPDVKINNVDYAEDILSVDLSSEFLKSRDPAIARAALVNSLLDLGTFKYIKLYVDGKEVTHTGDNENVVFGLLTRYPNNVPEIKAYEAQNAEGKGKTNRELFFQDNQGMYLLPEVRSITVTGGNYAEAIVNELIKGPVAADEGYYPTLPKGTSLHKTAVINGKDGAHGIALYFSKEFRTQFTGGSSQEIAMLSSLVYSLTSLPDVNFVKIYYENEAGRYIDEPVHNAALDQGLTMDHFPNMVGKRIRVYFGDQQGMLLVPEYRDISKDGKDIAARILSELAGNPIHPDSVRVIPSDIAPEDIKVRVDKNLAIVDIPSSYFNEEKNDDKKTIRDLYAIVNSLADPVNLSDIRQVQFTVDGKAIERYDEISLQDPFVMNPALIKEE